MGTAEPRDLDTTVDGEAVKNGLPLSCFTDQAHDTTFHFQILRLTDQLYVWVSCNSARLGNLYLSMPTRYAQTPSLAVLLGGGADSPGASTARRLALRTGWSIVLASNIPSKSPTLEAFAEKRLLQELKSLGYIKAGLTIQEPVAKLSLDDLP